MKVAMISAPTIGPIGGALIAITVLAASIPAQSTTCRALLAVMRCGDLDEDTEARTIDVSKAAMIAWFDMPMNQDP